MAYDPLRYVDNTGTMIAEAGNRFANNLSSFLVSNEAWNRLKKNKASDLDKKRKFVESAYQVLRDNGIDPKAVGLDGINYQDERVDFESLVNEFGNKMSGSFQGAKAIPSEAATKIGISDNEKVKDRIARQGLLNQYGYYDKTDFSKAVDNDPLAEIKAESPELYNSGILGNKIEPVETPINKMDSFFDELAPMYLESVARGDVSPDKVAEKLLDLKAMDKKIEIEDAKSKTTFENDLKKAWISEAANASRTNRMTDTSGRPLPALTLENAPSAGIGAPYPSKSETSEPKTRDKPTTSWSQYDKINSQLARLRSGKDEEGVALIFSSDPAENKDMIAREYEAKQYEAIANLLAHFLETSGETYDNAQNMAFETIDTKAVLDNANRDEPIITDGDGKFIGLNMSNPQTLKALVLAAQSGKKASDVLNVLRRSKGLNPSKQY